METIGKIDLDIEEGDFVIILGESGCGKSTLLNMIAGLMPLTSGEIRVIGSLSLVVVFMTN